MNKKTSETLLSVVIISRNEEKNIANCIESVLRATKEIKDYEIILVDSASTDETIEIAKQYPIKIIQIDSSSHISPSAGRYIGFLHSNGKYTQFIDGDMVLYEDWFEKSLQLINVDMIAGVTGLTTEIDFKKQAKDLEGHQQIVVDILEGAALYKREVLNKVGAYNPYLYGDEEAELSYRLRRAGYTLLKLRYSMVTHYGRITSLKEFKTRISRKYYLGYGQTLRYSLNKPQLFFAHLWRLRLYLLYSIWLLITFTSFCVHIFFSVVCGVVTLFFIFLFLVKKRSVKELLLSLLSWSLSSIGILFGFFYPPRNPTLYLKKSTIRIL